MTDWLTVWVALVAAFIGAGIGSFVRGFILGARVVGAMHRARRAKAARRGGGLQ